MPTETTEEIEDGELTESKLAIDNSASLFEEISSSSDDEVLKDSGDKLDKRENSNKTCKVKDVLTESSKETTVSHQDSIKGRIIRKQTAPSPIFAPKRSQNAKCQDLRSKLMKSFPKPRALSTPKSSQATLNSTSTSDSVTELERPMKTVYMKIITKFEQDGKKVKIVEKKVPA